MAKSLRASVLAVAMAALSVAVAPAAEPGADAPSQSLPYIPSLDPASMDKTADPCEDFYRYACGGWLKNNPIPADQASWSVYGKLYQDNQRFLWGILLDLAPPNDKRMAGQQKIGDYFAACMATERIEGLGATPLAPTLALIDGIDAKTALPAVIARLHLEIPGAGLLFNAGSSQDFADSTRVIAFLEAGGLGLPDRDYYTRDDENAKTIRTKYQAHVAKMLGLIGEQGDVAAKAAMIMGLESRLARASLTRVERRDPQRLFHDMDVAGLKSLAPGFGWPAYFAGIGVAQPAVLNVTEPAFYKELDALLAETSLDDLKTYLRWHAVHGWAKVLSAAFEDEDFDFYGRTLRGTPQQRPRWKRCVTLVDRQLGEALGQEFVRRVFSPELKGATLTMTRQIETAMEGEIKTLDWMSEATKRRAVEKLHLIANKIGYPDKWRDYGKVDIRADDFAGNVTRAEIFESRRELDKIGKPVDRSEWGMTPQTVNAYYDPQLNDINFPAGVLQPPLYDPKLDDAPNYGNTGGTIGHELTHGFDDEGRQFDGNGNLKDWWAPADAEKFKQRTQCIVDQYAQYTVIDDIKINSRLTLGEDIADLGGLILAHIAWKAQTAKQSLAPIGGLTPEQRFFVGYAQWACANVRPEQARLTAATDPHSPGRYRVNGLVVNMPEFAKAFACKAGQPMVKEKVCKVW